MIAIRLAQTCDASTIAAIYGPIVESTSISFEIDPPDGHEIERRITKVLTLAPWLVAAENGEVLGYVYASRHHERAAYRWSVDVSVYIRKDQRRRGIARALYTTLFAMLRLQGFYAAHAGITLPNAASVGLHESLGFVPIGVYKAVGHKLGEWHDVGYWQLVLRERVGIPEPPLSVAALQSHVGWSDALEAGQHVLCASARSSASHRCA